MLWNWLLCAALACFGVFSFEMMASPRSKQTDEDAIRRMVYDAVRRLNQGDLTAVRDYWDENADYVGIDGRFLHGRGDMESFFAQLIKAGFGTETGMIEQVRFLASDLAIVDGSWTITGTRGEDGQPLPPIRGRGCEIVQKRRGRWRFVATREMALRQS